MINGVPELEPVTWSLAFVRAPLAEVERTAIEWRSRLGAGPRATRAMTDLAGAVALLDPFDGRREVLVAMRSSPWTCYFHNQRPGVHASGPVSYLGELLNVDAVAVGWEPATLSADVRVGSWGAAVFEYWGNRDGRYEALRSIAAVNDGGRWVWHEYGPRLPFERHDAYTARHVRDRLTREMLVDYARGLGIQVADPAAYGPAVVAITQTAMRGLEPPMDLTTARAERGLGGGRSTPH